VKLHFTKNYCVNLKSVVNFQVFLKQNYATEVTMRSACKQKYGFASSPSAFAVLTALDVEDVWRLSTSFDVI
jgi:hypothetical protein